MLKKIILLIFALILVGLIVFFVLPRKSPLPPDENSNNVVTKPKIEIPKDKETCLASNGKWTKIGLAPREGCNLPTLDGGKKCSDASECEGTCLAALSSGERDQVMRERKTIQRNGTCTPWVITVGCQARVQNGKVNGLLCLD